MIPRKTPKGGGLFTAASSTARNSTTTSTDDQRAPVTLNGQTSHSLIASTSRLADSKARRVRESSIESTALDEADFTRPDTTVNKKRKVAPSVSTAGSKDKGKGKKLKQKELNFVPTVPFPPHFVKLEKTFKALNTVYTFVTARKHLAASLTFDMLKGAVEDILKRPLEMNDIAQMKALLPDIIVFAWIDSEILRVHAAGGDEKTIRRNAKTKAIDDAFESAASGSGKKKEENKEVVLLFSFNDGELKSSNGVGKLFLRKFQKKKKGEENLPPKPVEKTPNFTAASMAALIEKRNSKFSLAVSELIIACEAHLPPEDPVELLLAAAEDNMPVRPEDDRKGLGERKDDLEYYQRNPDKRPSIVSVIEEIRDQDWYREQIVEGGHRTFDAREGSFGELDVNISENIWDALYSTKKITQLYAHQASAINHLSSGRNVIVSTATSSGKSLVYQIPAVVAMEKDHSATAMYIFPTKALAQDQKRALAELLGCCEGMESIKVATFDGDTSKDDRDYIRENANVIFTNPDMLHLTVLPQEEKWRRFFSGLRLVVVDELHSYAGLFGCHVAFVMRRLRRICAALGNTQVQFVSCSATIANPAEHMSAVFGISDVVVIDEDSSPTGSKEYLIWNPPYIDDVDVKQGRVSTISESSRLFRFLMDRGLRVIVFCKVRQQCEILMRQVRADLMLEGRSDMASRVMSYRSGYSAADRRKIEQEMFSGQLLGVIATTALELGVDIGSLDAVITVGFPYHLPGLRQQAGRAGRRNKDSLAVLICDPWPLDQHYAAKPDLIFSSPFNELALDLSNPIVLEAHLQCAADEVPIHVETDEAYFGPLLSQICKERLVEDDEGFFHCHPRYKPSPAKLAPIRNTEDESYSVIDISRGRYEIIEEIELSRAIFTVYEGAIYMHMGRTFVVKELNHESKFARVEEATVEWRTRVRDFTNIDPLETLTVRELRNSDALASYGTILITSVIFGYFKTDKRNNILDTVDISSPPFVRSSHGFWIDVPASALEILLAKNLHPAASIHAAEHALMSLTPIVAMCAEGDVKTECKQPEKETTSTPTTRKRPARLILYDAAGKSGGICARAFDHVSVLLEQAADTIANCPCVEGCPSCVASLLCSGANTIVSKLGARVVLDSILGRHIDIDSIPMQAPATGVTPGSTIDLVGAGVRPGRVAALTREARGVMEEDEMDQDEVEERERALAELMGGGAGVAPSASVMVEGVEERERFSLAATGGFLR